MMPNVIVFMALSAAAPLAVAEPAISLSPAGPISTLTAARDAARSAPKPAKVVVATGTYFITEAMRLDAADSGVTWEAAPGARPVISGGKRITGWKLMEGGVWQADIPEARDGKWVFEQLWINGRRAVRARTPDTGWLNMAGKASTELFPQQEARDLEFTSFVAHPGDFDVLAAIPAGERSRALMIVPHTWEVHRYRLAELNSEAHAVRVEGPHIWEFLNHEPDGRYYVENFREALDSPGEWFLTTTGQLLYRALPSEDLATAEVVAPVSQRLLAMEGVQDVTFRGLTFAHTQYVTPEKGRGANQAATDQSASVEIDHAERLAFENCEFVHTAGYGIWFRKAVQNCRMIHCYFHDLGAGGIRIGEFSGLPEWGNATGHITVDNCILQHGGRLFPAAVGVLVGHSGDNTITHCDIGDFLYSSISLGWVWGYTESPAKRNRVENCHLHHLGWGYISDMGGIYCLGPSEGTVLRGNHIHHVASYRYGGWGLYTDEGSSGILLENNLVHDTSESCFHQHYGYDNYVRNNILAYGGRAMLQRSRNEDRLSFVFENNLLLWSGSKLLDGTRYNWDSRFYVMRRNLYWREGGQPFDFAGTWDWNGWRQMGKDTQSIIADPKFEDAGKRDFRLKEDSPAFQLGFKPWDTTMAGVRKDDPNWVKLAASGTEFPTWEADSKPWPSPDFNLGLETFEFTALGSCQLPRQSVNPGGEGASLGVSEDAGSPIPLPGAKPRAGRKPRSLKFQDAPDLKHIWDPHLFLTPKWQDGITSVSFDAMAEPGADWYCEFRDAGSIYHVGPSIWCQGGKIGVGKGGAQRVWEIPPGQWARFLVTARFGPEAKGTWDVSILRQDGQQKDFTGLKCDPEWKTFDWIGWTSLANAKTALYLDNLRIMRRME